MKKWAWFIVTIGLLVFATAPMYEAQYLIMAMGLGIVLVGLLFILIKGKKK